mmetsp:Transcript_51367/g.119785  ORF Transcript_51367/g.119785 Transcript_51367/m.119785 type:complete len:220 (+) Transcript_51367:180-839(+)
MIGSGTIPCHVRVEQVGVVLDLPQAASSASRVALPPQVPPAEALRTLRLCLLHKAQLHRLKHQAEHVLHPPFVQLRSRDFLPIYQHHLPVWDGEGQDVDVRPDRKEGQVHQEDADDRRPLPRLHHVRRRQLLTFRAAHVGDAGVGLLVEEEGQDDEGSSRKLDPRHLVRVRGGQEPCGGPLATLGGIQEHHVDEVDEVNHHMPDHIQQQCSVKRGVVAP